MKHGKWSDESAKEFFGQSTYLRPGRDNDKVKFHREKQYRISEMETLKGEFGSCIYYVIADREGGSLQMITVICKGGGACQTGLNLKFMIIGFDPTKIEGTLCEDLVYCKIYNKESTRYKSKYLH